VTAAIAILAAVFSLPALQNDDKDRLKRFEEPYKDKRQDSPKKDPVDVTASAGWDDDDDGDEGLCEFLFEWTIGYPFHDTGMRYDDFPYAHEDRPYFMKRKMRPTDKFLAFESRVQIGRIEHDLLSYGGSGELRLPTGSSVSFDVVRYLESQTGRDDRLTLQEYAINFGIAGPERPFQITLGLLGIGYLQGSDFGKASFLLQVDADWFVAPPFRIRARAGQMWFSGKGLTDLRLEGAVHVHRVAFLLGVRSLINADGEDLTGPTLGLEIWF
jgi:hypothetical protein